MLPTVFKRHKCINLERKESGHISLIGFFSLHEKQYIEVKLCASDLLHKLDCFNLEMFEGISVK